MDPVNTGGGISREELEFLKDKIGSKVARMANNFSGNRYRETSWQNLLSHQYMAMGGPHYRAVIVLDVDNPEHFEKLKRFPLAPNLIGIRSGPYHRGHFQAIWVLEFPVKTEDRLKTRWLERIMEAMGRAIGADPHFSGCLSRNPFYSLRGASYSWHWLHDRQAVLGDLQEACRMVGVDLKRTQKKREDVDAIERVAGVDRGPRVGPKHDPGKFRPLRCEVDGDRVLRNCWLFLAVTEHARLHSGPVTEEWCMELLHEANNLLEELLWVDAVYRDAHTNPWTSYGLPEAELRDIARSISQYWSATARSGLSWYTREEASLGGKRTQAKHRGKVLAQLAKGRDASLERRVQRALKRRQSVRVLLEEGLSKRAIAEHLNVTERTVYRDVAALETEALREEAEALQKKRESTTFVESQKDIPPQLEQYSTFNTPSISTKRLLQEAQAYLEDPPPPSLPLQT